MRPSPRPVLLPPPVLAASPGPPFFLSCCCWPPPAVFPLVPVRSLAFSARFAACVCLGVSLVAPLFVWPLAVFVGFALVWCCWSALPVLMLVWWAVLVASLLR